MDKQVKDISVTDMLKKLDEMYMKEDKLLSEYAQLKEDIEMLEKMIMYKSNKIKRER